MYGETFESPPPEQSWPECQRILWIHKESGGRYVHIFLPFLQILFEYLLKHGVRIAFFSSGHKERNLSVLSELLQFFWGIEKYEELKSKAQFAIHSTKDDMQERIRAMFEGENTVKDLRKVILDGESLSDIILVDDDQSYRAYDQKLFIVVMGLYPAWSSKTSRLNNIYYKLGLFKTYFEHEKYNKLSLRDGLDLILPTEGSPHPHETRVFERYFNENHPFAQSMMDIGLFEIRKQFPNATLYSGRRDYF